MSPDASHLPILETQRLRLTPVETDDCGHIFTLMRDAEVMAFWDMPESDDPDLIAGIVEGQVEEMAGGRAIYWAMRSLPDDHFIGVCDLSEIDRRHRRAEVGFLLGREAWGQGYAQEAMQAVLAFAGAQGLRRLLARTHLGNRRSDSLLENLGFREEGMLRGHVLRDGERRDCRLFGLLL
ncbi:MAG: GNAT family N-acetyltransferase [Caulobacterales bacterium]|jgi:ribosomal-protein-alanine N-acetyltransferase